MSGWYNISIQLLWICETRTWILKYIKKGILWRAWSKTIDMFHGTEKICENGSFFPSILHNNERVFFSLKNIHFSKAFSLTSHNNIKDYVLFPCLKKTYFSLLADNRYILCYLMTKNYIYFFFGTSYTQLFFIGRHIL